MWLLLALGSFAAVACGSDASQPSTDASNGDAPRSADAAIIAPLTAGDWQHTTVTVTSDSCGSALDQNGGLATVTVTGATAFSFRWSWGDGTLVSSCVSQPNRSFTCTTPATVFDSRPAKDAVVTGTIVVAGMIQTTTRVSATRSFRLSCVGTACGEVVAQAPCMKNSTAIIEKL